MRSSLSNSGTNNGDPGSVVKIPLLASFLRRAPTVRSGIKAKAKVPKNPTLFPPRNIVGGLGVHATTAGFYGNDVENQTINVFVVDRLQKMKSGVISRIPKRSKDEKNSNKIALKSSMASTDRSVVSLFIKSAMDFGPLNQSRPYLQMKRTAGSETGASAFPDLGWYFKSLATEAQKRFEVNKTQRFITNHGHFQKLRRSSYSFMDTELEAERLKVHVINERGIKQKQYIYQPGRKRYHNVKSQGKIRMINSVEYDNHPSIVKLEGFGTNEIVINFSLTPLGSIMFNTDPEDLSLLPQYYMIAKFIQYHTFNEELLLRYLNIQSNTLKSDMESKGIVKLITNETANQMRRGGIKNKRWVESTSGNNLNNKNSKKDNTAVTWSDNQTSSGRDKSIKNLLFQLAKFFASSLMKGGLTNRKETINNINETMTTDAWTTNFTISEQDSSLPNYTQLLQVRYEKEKLRKYPYETLLKHIHSSDDYDKNKKSFKNLTGKRIESVVFREIIISNELINQVENGDVVQKAFLLAIKNYSMFLDTEYNLRKYFQNLKDTKYENINPELHSVPQDRENAFRMKEQSLRKWEELLLVRNMISDCNNIREQLEKKETQELLLMIMNGDESAMFTNPYTDRSTLFSNMNLNNNTKKRVLSNGIYIDDSQFVFDYLSRKHLTSTVRIQQYSRYLQLLSKYSIIRNTEIENFYISAKNNSDASRRNYSAEIIVKCDFLISKIIDAVNQYNQWFSRKKKLTFTKHLGGKRITPGSTNMNVSFMDSNGQKSQSIFDQEKYDYIYRLFYGLVTKYITALDSTRNKSANQQSIQKFIKDRIDHVKAKGPNGEHIKVHKTFGVNNLEFANDATYRQFLKKMKEAPLTEKYRLYRRGNRSIIKKEAQLEEFNAVRKLLPFLQNSYYPLVYAFQSSGFADQLEATVNGRGYATSNKIKSDFKSIYGKGVLNSKLKMVMMYDFLQLISGIDKSRLIKQSSNQRSPLTDKDIGYDLFQGGEFHKTFGMVFSPFLPAYSAKTPPESKPFSVLSIQGVLGEEQFRISWPVQLYGREGDSDLPGRMSRTMLKTFTFDDDDFENVTKKSAGKYLNGYGQRLKGNGRLESYNVSKTVKNARGSYVPLHGVPYVTSDQLKGDRYFIGRSSDHKMKVQGNNSNTKFHVGGIKARTWIRTSSSDLHLENENPLVNSSIFTFEFNSKDSEVLETKMRGFLRDDEHGDKKLPTSWRTDEKLTNTRELINPNFGPLHTSTKMTYDKILEHTKTVQNDIIQNSTKTAKLLFPSFTWQNMIILYSKKLKSGSNLSNMTNEEMVNPAFDSLAMSNGDTQAVNNYFKKIVTDFMCASVYVAKSSGGSEWCAAQFLPFIDKTKNTFQTIFASELTKLGLNVYGANNSNNSNNSKHIYLLLPVALRSNASSSSNGDTLERVVDGELQEFYKEYNVMIQEGDNGYIISSCSWFKRPLNNSNNSNNKYSTSINGKITQPNTASKINAAKHSDEQWARMLDLHRVSARCFSKAAALQQMFEGTENTKGTKQSRRSWNRVVQYINASRIADEGFQARLARSLRRTQLRRRSQGNNLAGPSKNIRKTRAASTLPLATRRVGLKKPRRSMGGRAMIVPTGPTGPTGSAYYHYQPTGRADNLNAPIRNSRGGSSFLPNLPPEWKTVLANDASSNRGARSPRNVGLSVDSNSGSNTGRSNGGRGGRSNGGRGGNNGNNNERSALLARGHSNGNRRNGALRV